MALTLAFWDDCLFTGYLQCYLLPYLVVEDMSELPNSLTVWCSHLQLLIYGLIFNQCLCVTTPYWMHELFPPDITIFSVERGSECHMSEKKMPPLVKLSVRWLMYTFYLPAVCTSIAS